MAKIRTFVAFEVSGAVHGLVKKTIDDLSGFAGDYRWQRPDNLHLTLNFLGDIAEQEVPDVCRCVQKAVKGIPEFSIEIGGLGAFPRAERPRVLWLGVTDGLEDLLSLQSVLAKQLDDDMGFPPDRNDFCPHLTLGRINRTNAWHEDIVERVTHSPQTPNATTFVDEIIVYSSHMEKSGPIYTPMSTIELD